jgi:hypothetical protein
MTIATLDPQTQTVATTRDTRARRPTIHVGTFADGQRAEPLTAAYSAEIGSFANAEGE